MSLEQLNKIIENGEFYFYGLRKDSATYQPGDTVRNSHQLYQDPAFDEDGNLIYPYCSEGPYKGFYDAGELDGACAVEIVNGNIAQALKNMKGYYGEHIYLVAGNDGYPGNDVYTNEMVISEAQVLGELIEESKEE